MRKLHAEMKNMPEFRHCFFILCDSHGLQLLVKDIVESERWASVLKKVTRIITFFKKAKLQLARLRAYQLECYGKQKAFITPAITRWGTQLGAVMSSLANKDALRAYARDAMVLNSLKTKAIKGEEEKEEDQQALRAILSSINNFEFWHEVEMLAKILQPIENAQRCSERDHSCVGEVIPRWLTIQSKWDALEEANQDPLINYSELRQWRVQRMKDQTTDIHHFAFALDPRTTIGEGLGLDTMERAHRFLEENTSNEEYQQLFGEFCRFRAREGALFGPTSRIYREQPKTPHTPSHYYVLSAWGYFGSMGVKLATLARRVLGSLANSVPSERSFSATNYLHCKLPVGKLPRRNPSSLKVEARGTRRMENVLDGEDGRNTRALVLLDVAYVPRFHTNIVSAKRLARKGLWHCGFDNTLRMGTYEDNDVLCRLTDQYDLDVVEYKPVSRSYFKLPQSLISVFNAFQDVFSSFQANKPRRQRMAISRVPHPPRLDSSEIWHLRSCHAGPQALEQLVLQTKGVRIKGPTTVQCTACGTGKATEIISRRESSDRSRQPFYRIFVDIFEFPAAFNGHRYVLLITDEFSGMMFSWSLASKTEVSKIIKDFEARVKRHTGVSICKIRIDNERTIINLPSQRESEFQIWATEVGIEIELPPSHTKEPTGGAERPGGINQLRMRCMIGHLPQDLWPEFYRAATWIHNILPSRRNKWMSPKEKMDRWFHQHFRWYRPPNVDFDATKDFRPDWRGIYAYGCKAYPLNSRYKAGKDINQFKLGPRAHVGYRDGFKAESLHKMRFLH
ncbi:hypothetical protein MRS44_018282 [Fusarium solani]|uniref:uncharacterized protein n=1 Tax=Fusarium solani TaxID=169388 RepID=UPI0032C4455D|nr:hypothetical protein MRS44_018282 [Fusarium solani]